MTYWAFKENPLGQEEDSTASKKGKKESLGLMIESSTDLLREGIGQWKVDTWHRYQRRERDLQVSLIPSLSRLPLFFLLSFALPFPLLLLSRSFHFLSGLLFGLFHLIGEHLGRQRDLYRLTLLFAYCFILFCCSNVSSSSSSFMIHFCFLLPTLERPRCVVVPPSPLTRGGLAPLGPSPVALGSLTTLHGGSPFSRAALGG